MAFSIATPAGQSWYDAQDRLSVENAKKYGQDTYYDSTLHRSVSTSSWNGVSGSTGAASSTSTTAADQANQAAQRNARALLEGMLKNYGLESLGGVAFGYIQEGYTADAIMLLLQDTAEYKQRFAGNEARRKKGLAVLSPAEYLSVESSYRQIMSAAGLPMGFYDQPSDFTDWISNDVSPTEVKGRVDSAAKLVNDIDPNTRNIFGEWYTNGDMVAYALDRTRAVPIIERQVAAAKAGSLARAGNLTLTQSVAENIAAAGVSEGAQRDAYGTIGRTEPRRALLNDVYGTDLTASDMIGESLLGDAKAGLKRQRLASQERAAFSESSALNKGSLSRRDSGRI